MYIRPYGLFSLILGYGPRNTLKSVYVSRVPTQRAENLYTATFVVRTDTRGLSLFQKEKKNYI